MKVEFPSGSTHESPSPEIFLQFKFLQEGLVRCLEILHRHTRSSLIRLGVFVLLAVGFFMFQSNTFNYLVGILLLGLAIIAIDMIYIATDFSLHRKVASYVKEGEKLENRYDILPVKFFHNFEKAYSYRIVTFLRIFPAGIIIFFLSLMSLIFR